MQRVAQLLLVVAIALVSVLDAQIDPSLCPDGPITFIDPSWPVVPPQFEITAELVEKNDVAEISQAFFSQRDSIAFTIRGCKYSATHCEIKSTERQDCAERTIDRFVSMWCKENSSKAKTRFLFSRNITVLELCHQWTISSGSSCDWRKRSIPVFFWIYQF